MTGHTVPGPALEKFEAARETVYQVAKVTPMDTSQYLAELLGVPVYLKCENMQRGGSFKLRGAFYRLSQLSEEERSRGVVAASAGNHAQGVALAARELGIAATIFMPEGAALPKLQATKRYGADVILHGATITEALQAAAEYSARTGALTIPPFDHEDVVIGQGTLGLEILDEIPDLETVIVPIGGGGLAAGVASVVKQRAAAAGRSVKVIGVQAEAAASYRPSLLAGEPVQIQMGPTIADGIAVAKPGDLNFRMIESMVDEIVEVSEDDVAKAILVLLERTKLVVEAAGAVGVAAIIAGKVRAVGKTVVILSGGNIDVLLLQRVISQGLAASDRYLTVRVILPDRPGQLVRVAGLIADANANVVEVLHTRHGLGAQLSEVAIELSVETRGADHKQQVIETIRAGGLDVFVDE